MTEAPERIAILGAGGNSVDVLETILDINDAAATPRWECIGFLDDDPTLAGKRIHGAPILGPLARVRELGGCRLVFAIGSPSSFWRRRRILEQLEIDGARFATLVHPTASVSRFATLGPGCIVLQQATVTSGARLERHVMALPSSVVSHDAAIGEFTLIAGGACISGGVTVGAESYLGTNCAVIGKVRIGARCLIGMGAVVRQDVPENSVWVGNPGRFLRRVLPAAESAEPDET